MSLCMLCAQPTLGDQDVCVYHLHGQGDDWAIGNRLMCDFFHRGVIPSVPRDVETLEEAVA